MTLGDILQFANLVLIPILIYVIKLERALAVLETTRGEMFRRLKAIEIEIHAVHRRMDHVGMAHASSIAPVLP